MSLSVQATLKEHNGVIRLLEAHDVVSSDIVRNFYFQGNGFQGIWLSGLTHTTSLGIPDTEIMSPLERAYDLSSSIKLDSPGDRKLCAAFDADSGGDISEIPLLVNTLKSMGVTMIVIEDKDVHAPGQKVNSLLPADGSQAQSNPYEFASKIRAFKKRTDGTDMMVTARIESFNTRIVRADPVDDAVSVRDSLFDALSRASIYSQAGADAIMIHSKSDSSSEVIEFLQAFRETNQNMPLVVVPTTYSTTPRQVLIDAGANVIIYANHLMRAKMKGVGEYARAQLENNPLLFYTNVNKLAEIPARHCVESHNYACLLRQLGFWDCEEGANAEAMKFLVEAEQCALSFMARAALELVLGDKSGCEADSLMITVKELLKINAITIRYV
ncbi:hypothetical protein N7540_008727 [Penicillium herquei]|nr:hypothetical protein N7540_008727 [Penicillium herquei]